MQKHTERYPLQVTLSGILNATPDSFSDGGAFTSNAVAFSHAEKLILDGADWLDIGGDSTRPGSVCVGAEEEWKRIGTLIPLLSKRIPISVDTHHSSVAQWSLHAGASAINDVGGGKDESMWRVIADSDAQYIVMYSRCPAPHDFSFLDTPERNTRHALFEEIRTFVDATRARASEHHIAPHRVFIDPGMGRFLSSSPEVSLTVLSHLHEIDLHDMNLFLGISRKGFLSKLSGAPLSLDEKDGISCDLAESLAYELKRSVTFRVHNVKAHARLKL
jgi:dihydropteroate synthase